eukprot:365159-Chlamydomonas_euryale.AAC.13
MHAVWGRCQGEVHVVWGKVSRRQADLLPASCGGGGCKRQTCFRQRDDWEVVGTALQSTSHDQAWRPVTTSHGQSRPGMATRRPSSMIAMTACYRA